MPNHQLPLFKTENSTFPKRASLNYIGSKYRLLPFITRTIRETVGDVAGGVFAELFAGTGMVARSMKGQVRQVIVNDLEPYSYVLNRNYIGNNTLFDYDDMVAELNALSGVAGFIFEHYCLGGGHGRQYFSDANGRKIDAMRQTIETWYSNGTINADRYYFLLASLLESADKVANVASVYGAFLKHLKKTAQAPLTLSPACFEPSDGPHHVHQGDANALIETISGEVLYLDPPYNARQYGANYHLLNTIALYDAFTPQGKTGLRDYERSRYCQKERVADSFEALIAAADFRYIFLSYNNEGLMRVETVREIMAQYGRYELKTIPYQRFKADTDENRQHKAQATEEYLHVLSKA